MVFSSSVAFLDRLNLERFAWKTYHNQKRKVRYRRVLQASQVVRGDDADGGMLWNSVHQINRGDVVSCLNHAAERWQSG